MKKFLTITLIAASAFAAEGYKILTKIKIGGEGRWDYTTMDSANRRLYVSHGSSVEVVDPDGVGELVRLGVQRGRATRPSLKIGVCGEHGGDPESISTFAKAGLDYVSCSPFRVPIARLAAAQSILEIDGKA